MKKNIQEVKLGDLNTVFKSTNEMSVFNKLCRFLTFYPWSKLKNSIKKEGYKPEKYGYIKVVNQSKSVTYKYDLKNSKWVRQNTGNKVKEEFIESINSVNWFSQLSHLVVVLEKLYYDLLVKLNLFNELKGYKFDTISGNHRIRALKDLYSENYKIMVEIDDTEQAKLTVGRYQSRVHRCRPRNFCNQEEMIKDEKL
jgi:hypothetical protein